MLLVVDAGNTQIKFAIFEGTVLREHWRIRTEVDRPVDEYTALLHVLFMRAGLIFSQIEDIALATVVPALLPNLTRLAVESFKHTPLIVSASTDTGLEIAYQPPTDVGVDRLADAAGAVDKYGAPCIVIDFGTATTFNAIAAPKSEGNRPIYLGGAICLGITVSLDALFAKAAKIPRIEVAKPPTAIADNTRHALQSGIFFGYLAQVESLIDRFRNELDAPDCPVIVTGGNAGQLVAAESRSVTAVEPLLTMVGLRLIYERNRANPYVSER